MATSPATAGSRSNRSVLLAVTCLGQFMVLLDNTIEGRRCRTEPTDSDAVTASNTVPVNSR